jgi:hypothetical protein
MESHKRILGILYIVSGVLQTIILSLVAAFIGSLFPFIASEVDPKAEQILMLVGKFIPIFVWSLILVVAVPCIIGGVAILNKKKWALTLLLIMGCLKLFSFPIGTALGIYTIWVYSEDNKFKSAA